MNSVIQIFQVLAQIDETRRDVCNSIRKTGACHEDCDECAYKNHDSMQRAANILTNELGG